MKIRYTFFYLLLGIGCCSPLNADIPASVTAIANSALIIGLARSISYASTAVHEAAHYATFNYFYPGSATGIQINNDLLVSGSTHLNSELLDSFIDQAPHALSTKMKLTACFGSGVVAEGIFLATAYATLTFLQKRNGWFERHASLLKHITLARLLFSCMVLLPSIYANNVPSDGYNIAINYCSEQTVKNLSALCKPLNTLVGYCAGLCLTDGMIQHVMGKPFSHYVHILKNRFITR